MFEPLFPAAATNRMSFAFALLIASRSDCEKPPPPQLADNTRTFAIPELLKAASLGTLRFPAVFDKQLKRLLADPRSETLSTRFASQWLRLQDVNKVHPDPNNYPNFDDNLAAAMRRETELFFNSLVREDRSVLDLYRADYTYVNERLARGAEQPRRCMRVAVTGEQNRLEEEHRRRPDCLRAAEQGQDHLRH